MADELKKGITISFKGDTQEFDSSLGKVNKSLTKEKTILKEINSELKLDPKNVDLLSAKLGSLQKQEDLLKTKITEYNKELDKLSDADIGGKQWELIQKNLTNANYELSKVKKNIDDTNYAIKGGGFDELSKNINNASSGALNFGDVLKANVLSDAIVGGIKALANAFKEVGTYAYESVRDSGKLADEINTLAKQYNLSTKQIQQYMKASELIDVDVNTITKSMSKLTKNMSNPSTSVSEAFKKLGISVRNNKGELRDSNEVFNETISKLAEVSNETQQDAYALEIFGKSASDLGPLINGGAEQLEKFNEYLEENNLLLSDAELTDLNNMNDSFDTLKATIDGITQKISSKLAPYIQPIIDSITNFINEHQPQIDAFIDKVIEWFNSDSTKNFFEGVSQVATDVGDILKTLYDIGEELGLWGGENGELTLVGKLFNGIKSDVENFKKDMNTILETIRKIKEEGFFSLDSTYINHGRNALGNGMGYSLVGSGGYGALQSGGFTSNLTINVNTNQMITEQQVRGWASIINEELGQMV